MNISAPFVRRPVGTMLMTIGITLVGIIAFQFLPVAALPQVEFPTINVSASLPGASPETMASSVAAPLERQFTRIAGVSLNQGRYVVVRGLNERHATVTLNGSSLPSPDPSRRCRSPGPAR